MPQVCKVCQHDDRATIDEMLAQGTAKRAVARKFGMSSDSVGRHAAKHLPAAVVKAETAREAAQADSLLERILDMERRACRFLEVAERMNRTPDGLAAIREVRACLELLARVAGELPPPTINLTLTQEWIDLRTLVVHALEPFPEARAAVAEVLGAGA